MLDIITTHITLPPLVHCLRSRLRKFESATLAEAEAVLVHHTAYTAQQLEQTLSWPKQGPLSVRGDDKNSATLYLKIASSK